MFFNKSDNSQPPADASSLIFDVNTQDFEQRVIAASMQVPVIVDFWAPWCGPCKQLMPILEKAVTAAGGQVLLAKVNLDDNPQLAQALQVQSVPTVYGFFQGQPVDAFMGVQPESNIQAFIKKLIAAANGEQPDAIDIPEALKGAAQALAEGDAQTAHAIYAQILQQDSMNADAYVGLVRTFLSIGQIEQAQGLIENAPEPIAKSSAFSQAQSALELAQNAGGDTVDLRARIDADPKDHQARIDYAHALFAQGQKEEACDALLESIRIDRAWNEEAARQELLKLFEAMGHADPVTLSARRQLSSILFS